jgi:hypothetical protein
MLRTLIVAGAAIMLFSAGSAINTSANAGGGAPFVVTKNTDAKVPHRNRTRNAGRHNTQITEFSSSSARSRAPHR